MKEENMKLRTELMRRMNALAADLLSSGERLGDSEELLELSRRAAELSEEEG